MSGRIPQSGARCNHADGSSRNRFPGIECLHVAGSQDGDGPRNCFQIVQQMNRSEIEVQFFCNGGLVNEPGQVGDLYRPPITGPATSKQARSTGIFTLSRNSFTMTCKLG